MRKRKKFNWTDPETGKKYKDICTTPKMVRILEKKIETPKQAESFLKAYSTVCTNAEHNIGYFANLIHDPDIKEDVLDLFGLPGQISPRQMLNREYRFTTLARP